MKKLVFEGMATALVTPMTPTGIDYEALGRFLDFQIENGINAVVANGTTGENATIEPMDQYELIRFTVQHVAGRVPVIAGTGTNNTAHVIENTKRACEAGADAVLVVTPYYNKATQNGLIAHFTAVADVSTVPVILYNVPGRTGCSLQPKTVAALADHPNIVGLKEASGNMAQFMELMRLCGDKIAIYSGEDALTAPMMSMGCKGAISVLSNVVPAQAVAMTDAARAGNFEEAARLQLSMLPLIDALFCETNPAPVKWLMHHLGLISDEIRLPLTMPRAESRALIKKKYDEYLT